MNKKSGQEKPKKGTGDYSRPRKGTEKPLVERKRTIKRRKKGNGDGEPIVRKPK